MPRKQVNLNNQLTEIIVNITKCYQKSDDFRQKSITLIYYISHGKEK